MKALLFTSLASQHFKWDKRKRRKGERSKRETEAKKWSGFAV